MKTDITSRIAALSLLFIFLSNDLISATYWIIQGIPDFESVQIAQETRMFRNSEDLDYNPWSELRIPVKEDAENREATSVGRTPMADEIDFEVFGNAELKGYKMDKDQVAVLPQNVINVTRKAFAYELTGHSDSAYHIAMGVDPLRLQTLSELKQVRVYFFDKATQSWKQTHTLKVDEVSLRIEAMVPGETDYFAGLLQAPEMPEASAYVPTNISDIEPANPATGMNIMQPPAINRQGTANLSYPLDIPQGREGMTPPLSLSYTSEKGSSWLGEGWNISISSISVDTKWGVPKYSNGEESDPYILDGEELYMRGNYRPNRPNRTPTGQIEKESRVVGNVRFFKKVENGYSRIIRKGSSPQDYIWVVTDASGTKYLYGSTDGQNVSPAHVMRSRTTGEIGKWALARTEDKWGNTIVYNYSKPLFNSGGIKEGGQSMYISSIYYTGHGTTLGKYEVHFIPRQGPRHDGRVSMNYGFKVVDDLLLDRIEVRYDGGSTPSKEFKFDYIEGQSTQFKHLLQSISIYVNGQQFYSHTMDYYGGDVGYDATPSVVFETTMPNNYLLNSPSFLRPLLGELYATEKASPIGNTLTNGFGFSTGVGIGIGGTTKNGVVVWGFGLEVDKAASVTLSGGMSFNNSEQVSEFRDVNGDGLSDFIYQIHDQVYYTPLFRNDAGQFSVGRPTLIRGIQTIQENTSTNLNFKLEGVFPGNISSIGTSFATTTSLVNAQMLDYNSDGFLDYMTRSSKGDRVYFGVVDDKTGEYHFEGTSLNTDNPVFQTIPVDFPKPVTGGKKFETVRVWEAFADGTVRISGIIDLLDSAGKIKYSIQKNSTFIVSPTLLEGNSVERIDQTLTVQKGDKLVFRVDPEKDGQYDLVEWNPTVTYVNSNYPDGHGNEWGNVEAQKSFVLSNHQIVVIPASHKFRMSIDYSNGEAFSDDVQFRLKAKLKDGGKVSQREYVSVIPAGEIGSGPHLFDGTYGSVVPFIQSSGYFDATSISGVTASDTILMTFEVGSTSNINWNELDVSALIEFENPCPTVMRDIHVIPEIQSYDYAYSMQAQPIPFTNLDHASSYHMQPVLSTITPSMIQSIFQDLTHSYHELVYMTVKANGEVIEKMALRFDYDPSQTSLCGLSFSDIDMHQIGEITEGQDFETFGINRQVNQDMYAIGPNLNFSAEEVEGAPISVEFHSKGIYSNQLLALIEAELTSFNLYPSDGSTLVSWNSPANYFGSTQNDIQRHFLNWGMFGWSPDTTRGEYPIDVAKLYSPVRDMEVSDIDTAEIARNPRASDPNNFEFWPLSPMASSQENGFWELQTSIKKYDRYSLFGSHVLISRNNGNQTPGYPMEIENQTIVGPDLTEVKDPTSMIYGLMGNSSSKSITMNVGAENLGVSTSISDPYVFFSRSLNTMTDFNGDGYPDLVWDSNKSLFPVLTSSSTDLKIAQSDALGGFSFPTTMNTNSRISKGTSFGVSGSWTGAYTNEDLKQFKLGGSIGLSGNWSRQRDQFIDINGDGLPDSYKDEVLNPYPNFYLNQGGSFESHSYSYPYSFQNKARSFTDLSLASGLLMRYNLSFSLPVRGISFGMNVNPEKSASPEIFIDVNGDGLTDHLTRSISGSDELYLNTGTTFKKYTLAKDEFTQEGINQSKSIGFSAQGGVTIAPVIALLKLVFTGHASENFSQSNVESRLEDINGDGAPDAIIVENGAMNVYYANWGKANMLRSVTTPLGGEFVIDYKVVGNKRGYYKPEIKTHLSEETNERILWDMPSSKWVMNSLTINDHQNAERNGEDLDGSETIRQTFAYDGGIRLRRDRNFAGFTRIATYSPNSYELRHDACTERTDAEIEKDDVDVSEYYANHDNYIIEKVKVLKSSIKRFNYTVVDYVKPKSLEFNDLKAYSYVSDIAEHNYTLHGHEWRDIVRIRTNAMSEGWTDIIKLEHVDLISDQGVDYEIRMVHPLNGKVLADNAELDDWVTFDEAVKVSDVPENVTVFQATTLKRNINYPKVEDREHPTTQKFRVKYDEYRNVIWYEDFGTMLSARIDTVVVDTIYSGHFDTIHQQQPCRDIMIPANATALGNGYMVYPDGIHYMAWVKCLNRDYSIDTLYGTLAYTNGCFQMDATGPMATCQDYALGNMVTSVHEKWVEDTSYVYKIEDNSIYDFRIVAKMFYRDPVNSQGRTNMLAKHEIYTQGPSSLVLKRYAEVTEWWTANNLAPAVINNQLTQTFKSTTDAQTLLEYNVYGGVTRIIGPADHQGLRSERYFTYDSQVHQFVTEVSNQRSEKYNYWYNTELQTLLQTVDVNGHPTRYFHDDFNRIAHIWAPREIYAPSNGPTISFNYFPLGLVPTGTANEKVPVAISWHNTSSNGLGVNMGNASNIDTYRSKLALDTYTTATMPAMSQAVRTATLTDGLGSVVQIQTESDYDAPGGTVENAKILRISGIAEKDIFGEVVSQRNDFTSSTAVLGVFEVNDNEKISRTYYDFMSRPFQQYSIWSSTSGTPQVVTTSFDYAWRTGLNEHSGDFFSTQVTVDGENSQTEFVDPRGKTVAQTNDAEGILTEFKYDELAQLKEVYDPKGLKTSYVYDNFGRVTEENHPDRGITTSTYDPAGNLLTINWAGKVTQMTYEHSRLVNKHVTDPNSSVLYDVSYKYGEVSDGVNAVGRILKIYQGGDTSNPFLTDAFQYDELGQTHRVSRRIDRPNVGPKVYNTYSHYDSFGRVLRLIYPDQDVVDYHYSSLGSLERITSQLQTSPVMDVITHISYDGFDNISYLQYGNGTETRYTYHPYTRALTQTRTDAKENATSVQGLMNQRNFTFNNKGLISEVDFYINPGLIPQSSGNGWSSFHHTYDEANRLETSSMEYANGNVYALEMKYSTSGEITQKSSDIIGMGPLMTNPSVDYTLNYFYTGTHKLSFVNNTRTLENIELSYNPQGSIQSRKYRDSRGNLSPNKEETFVWNSDQQLVAVKNENTIQHYVYDYTGTRIMKTDLTQTGITVDDNLTSNTSVLDPYKVYVNEYYVESSGSNFEQTTKHYYMGMQRVLSDLSLQELLQAEDRTEGSTGGALMKTSTSSTSTPTSSTANAVLQDFKNQMTELGLNDGQDYNSTTLFDYNSLETLYPEYMDVYNSTHKTGYRDPANECCFYGDRYWYHPDYLGSVAMVTNSQGVVHQLFLTNAWGEELHTYDNPSTSSFNSEYRFNGKEFDEETGLAYYGARYYDNKMSMWLSVDPLAKEYPSFSPYNFVMNNPISLTDPNGMWVEDGDGNWVAEKGDSWWSFHEQTGMSWDETKQFAKDYNSARGEDNWKTVEVGDVASLEGSDEGQGYSYPSDDGLVESQHKGVGNNDQGLGYAYSTGEGFDLSSSGESSNEGGEHSIGFKQLRGPVLIGLGTRINALKPVGALGSQRGSSIASYTLRKVFPQRLSTRVFGTKVLGGVFGRFVPYAGQALLIYDVATLIGTPIQPRERPYISPYGGVGTNTRGFYTFGVNSAKSCLSKGTEINTSEGLVKIEELNEGDTVLSFSNGLIELTEVEEITSSTVRYIVRIILENGEIILATKSHPFLVSIDESEWVEAQYLQEEMILICQNSNLQIQSIEYLDSQLFETFNLRLSNGGAFLIGVNGIVADDISDLLYNKSSKQDSGD